MSYSKGPYATFESLPAPDATVLNSSRKVNFATKRYENDADGNPLSQPSIQQIVALKVTFNVPDEKLITPQSQEASRQAVLQALTDLTAPPSPLIDRVTVTFASERAGLQQNVINFRDLSTGLDQTVEF
jgi:hypothetical protein